MTEEAKPFCPVCGATDYRLRYRITRFRVLECVGCDLIYLWERPSEEEIAEMFRLLYTSGEGSVPELKSYYQFCFDDRPENPLVQQYEGHLALVERFKSPGRILDIGCGTGLFLSVARRRGWEVYGIDGSREATDHARECFGIEPWVGDFKDFATQGHTFDVITGWDIIEHAREPLDLLVAMRQCLAPDGLVALSTPNQRSILDLLAGLFYHATGGRLTSALEKFYIEQHFLYYTPDSLRDSLSLAGLEIVMQRRELTDLRRLTLSPPMRLVLQGMFVAARMLARENRLFVIARATGADPAREGA